MSLDICFAPEFDFNNTSTINNIFIDFLHIQYNTNIFGDIWKPTCKISISKIKNVGASVIPLFRVIFDEIFISCKGQFQGQVIKNIIFTK